MPATRIVTGALLQHVSRVGYRGAPLYFGRDGTNRYDAPRQDYGVLYLGRDLPTALMESVFHKHQWDRDARRSIALAEVERRLVRAVGVLADLHLADLTADGVMAGYFGLNLEQLASRVYTHTQRVSGQVHALREADNAFRFDGVLYPSRNNYPAASIALFDRAQAKVEVIDDIDLPDHAGWGAFVEHYQIGIEPDPEAEPDPEPEQDGPADA
nr:RES family NAD+ phosphorylase [Xanthomonas hortorum]